MFLPLMVPSIYWSSVMRARNIFHSIAYVANKCSRSFSPLQYPDLKKGHKTISYMNKRNMNAIHMTFQ